MQPYFNKMTKTGYQEIETEIEQLKLGRPAKIKALQEARALGDLSENAEYSSAKRDLRRVESRLRFLNKQLQYAQIVSPSNNSIIEIGKTVTIEFLDDHSQTTYQIVGKQEADLAEQKLAFDSPLGKALSNKKVGATVTILAPSGKYQVKIIEISI